MNRFQMDIIERIKIVLRIWVNRLIFLYKPIIILVISCNVVHAQSQRINKVDSLRTALSNTNTDTERLTLMNELSSLMINTDLEQSLLYARKVLALSRQMNDKEKEARAMFNIGMLLFETSNIDSSLIYFEASEHLADNLKSCRCQI